jgi:uncharacterized MAPEG superfamily protein
LGLRYTTMPEAAKFFEAFAAAAVAFSRVMLCGISPAREGTTVHYWLVWNIFYFPFHIWDNPSH